MFSGIKIVPLGFAQLSCASATVSTLTNIPAQADGALIRAEGANVRWCDGTLSGGLSGGTGIPTSTIGMLMVATTSGTLGDVPLDYMGTLSSLQFIPVGSTGATVDIAYYKIFASWLLAFLALELLTKIT